MRRMLGAFVIALLSLPAFFLLFGLDEALEIFAYLLVGVQVSNLVLMVLFGVLMVAVGVFGLLPMRYK